MDKRMKACATATLAATLAGCSTVDSWIYRPTNYEQLPQDLQNQDHKRPDYRPDVAALSVDASRRLVMSQKRPPLFVGRSGDRVTCSEPPPDAALGILAKSALNASSNNPSGRALSGTFSDEFSTTVTALAKRSSNVEIWRTTSSTYCTLLMNGWDAQADAYLAAAEQFVVKIDDSSDFAAKQKKEPTPAELLEAAQAKLEKANMAMIKAKSAKRTADLQFTTVAASGDAEKLVEAKALATAAEYKVIEAEEQQELAKLELAIAQRKAPVAQATPAS